MHDFMNRFSILHRHSTIYLDRHLKMDGITGSQYTHILVICENPGVSQEDISDKLKIDKGSVARTVKQFEREGYITRLTSIEDKRQYRIYPTDKGKALYSKVHGIAIESENRLTKEFTDIEREILKNLLDKVMLNLE
ncbi:MarR family winged helix-turn-helix transcriptional regulator [Fusibacter sp. 3D3]|uniref:MarR family winged helix-turn-helix transcriptional regulator n=1 Tax=Fusibacter sp. 3D3 TaxID=1048380 RepID=UPI00085384A5|nr:MarR family transcriptional regulator [Fusibacter sp. 3D3]GAU75975.1 transcriptional regulator [Fusibacter sp. 3D3]